MRSKHKNSKTGYAKARMSKNRKIATASTGKRLTRSQRFDQFIKQNVKVRKYDKNKLITIHSGFGFSKTHNGFVPNSS